MLLSLTAFAKRRSHTIPSIARHVLRSSVPTPAFSSFSRRNPVLDQISNEQNEEKLPVPITSSSTNLYINSYMKKLYCYLGIAATVGISSSHLISMSIPLGFPSAFMILAGFGLEHYGSEYINRTKSQAFVYKDIEGNMQYGNSNPLYRRLAFLSSCLGYGCIIGSFLGMVPFSSIVLPLTAFTCLFSTLGHFIYSNLASTGPFKPTHMMLSGIIAGIIGLNFVTTVPGFLMWKNPFTPESLQLGTYAGLIIYNCLTANDSKNAVEDIKKGKGDHLKHGSKYAENWLSALLPHYFF